MKDRALGALWGVAVGDALGATTEFMDPAAIASRFGVHRDIVGGGVFGWRPGQGTDDSDLTAAVAAAYLDDGDPVANARDRFVAWFHTSPRDIGGTTRVALAKAADGVTTSGLSTESSCGNGSLMRAIPTAVARRTYRARLCDESAAISAITHAHDRCIQACVAYNVIAALLISGASTTAAITQASCAVSDPDVLAALRVDPGLDVAELSTSGYVIDSLRCAAWAIQQQASFEDIMVALVNRGDDADTTAAIAGGLTGAAFGAGEIPQRWLTKLEYRDQFAHYTEHLYA